jgi:hypothetical protein
MPRSDIHHEPLAIAWNGPARLYDRHASERIDEAMNNLTIVKTAAAAFLASVRDVPPETGVDGYELADAVAVLAEFATADLDAERAAMEEQT